MMAYSEGQTATNPKTGQQVVFKGGQWVNVPSATGVNSSAPGAGYLPQTRAMPSKSEDAYYGDFRKADDPRIAAARSGASRARRAEGLMENQDTGGLYAVPVVGNVVGMFDPEIRELDAIQSEVARSKRQPGEGAISDFDAQQFIAMTYGKDKPTETNRSLIRAQRLADEAAIQRRAFTEWHYNTFGTTSGAAEAWTRYAEDNPIFDPASESEGRPVLNTGRQQWREYFGSVRGGADARPSQTEQDIRRAAGAPVDRPTRAPIQSRIAPTGLTEQQKRAAGRYKGTKADSGTERNPSIPVSEEQYNALPPGTWYIHRSGTVTQKKK